MATGTVSWGVKLEGVSTLNKALRVLQEPEAPFLKEALTKSGKLLQHAAMSRAPGGIAQKVDFVGIRGSGGGIRALIKIDHPGGRSMEFGRIWYYRAWGSASGAKRAANITKFLGYNEKFTGSATDLKRQRAAQKNLAAIGARIGNNRPGSKRAKGIMKRQEKFRGSPGQRARPYLGVIKGNAAIGAVTDDVTHLLSQAIRDEWDRITGQTYRGAS
jgi:hypothetical protein